MKWPYILTVLFAGGYVLLGFLPDNEWWGLNHLYFHAPSVRWIFIIAVAAALLTPIWRLIFTIIKRLEKLPVRVTVPMAAATAGLLFLLFRIMVHSLGDGYLRDIEIKDGQLYYATEMLDFFIHAVLYHLLNLFGKYPATTAMAAISIAAGVVFVFVLFLRAPFAGTKKHLFIILTLSLGGSQLFFGYVESYTLLYLFAFWYVLIVFREQPAKVSFAVLTPLYLLAGFSHQVGIILLPSLLYLTYLKFHGHSRKFAPLILMPLISIFPLLVPWILNQFFPTEGMIKLTDNFLPIIGNTYSIFSPAHLFDILNEILLVVPVFLMILPLVPRIVRVGKERLILALALFLPGILFILVIDPKLAMVRDWDLFSIPLTVAVLPVIVLIFETVDMKKSKASLKLTGTALVSAVVLCSWVLLNNSEAAHLRRAEYFLDRAVRNQSWGYEVLAIYYHRQDDFESELRILDKVKPADRTARMFGNMAQALYSSGRYDDAYRAAMQGMERANPTTLNYLVAGVTSLHSREFDQAVRYLKTAVKRDPDAVHTLCHLGDALWQAGHPDQAIEAYQKALALRQDLARAYFGLAYAHGAKHEHDQALQYCRQGLRLEPDSPVGQDLLRQIRSRKERNGD